MYKNMYPTEKILSYVLSEMLYNLTFYLSFTHTHTHMHTCSHTELQRGWEETLGDNGHVCDLDCGDGFAAFTYPQTHHVVYVKICAAFLRVNHTSVK